MKILYLSQYFPPEVGATQSRALEMTRYLAERGHEVTVICNLPNHPSGRIAPGYGGRWSKQEKFEKINLIRTWIYTRPHKSVLVRAGFYASFFCSSLWAGAKLPGPFDIVFATSPPPLVGLSGLLLSRRFGAPFVYEVRDLWLEMAVELQMIRSSLLRRWGAGLDRLLYRKARAIVVATQGIYDRLTAAGWREKLVLIRNGTNTEIFTDLGQAAKEQLGWRDKFVVLYAGVLGVAQGMDDICRLAYRLRDDASIVIALVGDGPMRSYLEKQQAQLPNLQLLGEVPRQRMATFISAADCCLAPLKRRQIFLGAVPSKMFDYLACRRPVILSVDGEARAILEKSGGGIYIEPEDVDGIANAIVHLRAHPALRQKMGQAGRDFVERYFTRRAAAERLEATLLRCLKR